MTLLLIFCAMAHQGHRASTSELLYQAQREFLSVVLDGSAASVYRAVKEQFLLVLLRKLRPGDFPILEGREKALTRTEIGHPNVIARRWQPTTAKSSDEPEKAITLAIDGRPGAFRSEHRPSPPAARRDRSVPER